MSREIVLLVLLILVAYRATRLVVRDAFPPVLWARDRLAGGWRPLSAKEKEIFHEFAPQDLGPDYTEINGVLNRYITRAKWSPHWLAELITCPWCASAYVSGALVLITDCVIGIQWPWLMGGAVWAGASLIASRPTA